ncbi:hypothetical protein RJ639_013006 [Escallonia herrerae]|uniref:UBN2_2 domain-containing protein n=1 Tax=Escallonia herrerae TaxID=1293975 RepID=A0AA89ARH2_9ASTE|nr:hypothetical protein RJ639_013006 [Escallonia herrerae]
MWELSNRISLMIIKGSITTANRGAILDSDNAKLYLAYIEEQFQGSSKAHATTLITKMITLKYSGSNGVREHILWINDVASQLKGLDMEIFEGFLVHLIMTSLSAQFGLFKINYNTQKVKWKMNELISMCVQKEERLKSEQPDRAHVTITAPSKGKGKGKGKKFDKGSLQGNKSASVTKTDKTSSSGTKGSFDLRWLFESAKKPPWWQGGVCGTFTWVRWAVARRAPSRGGQSMSVRLCEIFTVVTLLIMKAFQMGSSVPQLGE